MPHGYKDVFCCLSCRGVGVADEFKCNGCGSHVCQHLVLIDGGLVICFCCYKDQERVWPDWVFAVLPDRSDK